MFTVYHSQDGQDYQYWLSLFQEKHEPVQTDIKQQMAKMPSGN